MLLRHLCVAWVLNWIKFLFCSVLKECSDFNSFFSSRMQCIALFSSPEPKAYWWTYRIGRPPSSVRPSSVRRPHSLNIFSSETTGPIKVKFHMELLWDWGTKVPSNGHDHMPIYGKNQKKPTSPEPKGRWPLNLVCSIEYSSTTKFLQMMTLGWPWPITARSNLVPYAFVWGKR